MSCPDKNRISHGDNGGYYAATGRTISWVRRKLKDPLDLTDDLIALADGQAVTENHVLQFGQEIEFIPASENRDSK